VSNKLHLALQNLYSSLPQRVVFHSSKEGSYWVELPNLPTCYAYGDSLPEAMMNTKFAVFDYFDVPKKFQNPGRLIYESGKRVPISDVDPTPLVKSERVEEEVNAEILVSN